MLLRTIVFLIINFAGLGIGGLFTSMGTSSSWYSDLNKAPWTPPGWVFGAAWTIIMICFAIYMAYAWGQTADKNKLLLLFSLQWVLNVVWNPVFFKFHYPFAGLIIIVSLSLLIAYMLFRNFELLSHISWLALPYLLWLIIATSLNLYIVLNN